MFLAAFTSAWPAKLHWPKASAPWISR